MAPADRRPAAQDPRAQDPRVYPFSLREGQVAAVYAVLAPDKLTHLPELS